MAKRKRKHQKTGVPQRGGRLHPAVAKIAEELGRTPELEDIANEAEARAPMNAAMSAVALRARLEIESRHGVESHYQSRLNGILNEEEATLLVDARHDARRVPPKTRLRGSMRREDIDVVSPRAVKNITGEYPIIDYPMTGRPRTGVDVPYGPTRDDIEEEIDEMRRRGALEADGVDADAVDEVFGPRYMEKPFGTRTIADIDADGLVKYIGAERAQELKQLQVRMEHDPDGRHGRRAMAIMHDAYQHAIRMRDELGEKAFHLERNLAEIQYEIATYDEKNIVSMRRSTELDVLRLLGLIKSTGETE